MVHIFSRSVESSGDELFGILYEILENQRKIMGDFTALNSALASLGSAVAANTAAVASVSALVGTLKVAPDQAQIDAATTQVSAAITQVQTNNTSMANLVTPPPAPVSTASS